MRILHFKYLCIWNSDTPEHCFQCRRLAYLELWPNLYSFMCICVFVFACQTNGNFVFEVLISLPFKKYSTYWATLTKVVFVYLEMRHLGTFFVRSSHHIPFKNITYVRHICNFDLNCSCICVFVYLYLCICTSDNR